MSVRTVGQYVVPSVASDSTASAVLSETTQPSGYDTADVFPFQVSFNTSLDDPPSVTVELPSSVSPHSLRNCKSWASPTAHPTSTARSLSL